MAEVVVPAVIAAAVSVTISLYTQMLLHRQWAEDRNRSMTERLYERRIETYPIAMRLTEPLRGDVLRDFRGDKALLLADVGSKLEDWRSGDAAFIVSRKSHAATMSLRDALQSQLAEGDRFTEAEVETLWNAKNDFRLSLRQDMRLLYGEDVAE